MKTAFLLLLSVPTFAQTTVQTSQQPTAVVSYSFERAQMPIPRYEIRVGRDGHGTYSGETKEGVKLDAPITVSEANTKKIWDEAEATKSFSGPCETKIKNLAQTGKKTLKVLAADTGPGCTFNYSDSKTLQSVSDLFQSMAQTMEAGERLKHDLRFDHLGLDAEMTSLVALVKEGRAVEVQNIAPILKKIVADETLLERVRIKAQKLLDDSSSK